MFNEILTCYIIINILINNKGIEPYYEIVDINFGTVGGFGNLG